MSIVNIVNKNNERVGEMDLNDAVFNREVKEHILHEVVRAQRAAKRAGNACTKTRVEVSGGGRKPWRQKGTGRARSGSRTSPVWRGGGTAFGPKPRDYDFKINSKVRKQALAMAMSARFQEGNLIVVDDLTLAQIKSKEFVGIMNTLEVNNGLIITDNSGENLFKSSRNVVGFKVMSSQGINVFDVLLHKKLILVQPVIDSLEKRCIA